MYNAEHAKGCNANGINQSFSFEEERYLCKRETVAGDALVCGNLSLRSHV